MTGVVKRERSIKGVQGKTGVAPHIDLIVHLAHAVYLQGFDDLVYASSALSAANMSRRLRVAADSRVASWWSTSSRARFRLEDCWSVRMIAGFKAQAGFNAAWLLRLCRDLNSASW